MDAGRTVVITGATGLVGRHVAARFREAGWRVRALSRDPGRARRVLPGLAAAEPWDPRHGRLEPAALAGADAVVHLAGAPVARRWTARVREEIRASRVDGTRLLAERLIDAVPRPPVLVSASAIGWYGDRGDAVLNEEAPPGEGFLAEVCRDWETAAGIAAAAGVRTVVLRVGIVLARDGGALPRMLPAARLGLGGPLGHGRQFWSWVHVEDVARLVLWAVETAGIEGPINATAPEPVRQAAFARELGRLLGRPAFLRTPGPVLRLVLGGFARELLASARVVPARATRHGFRFAHPGLGAALRDLLASPR